MKGNNGATVAQKLFSFLCHISLSGPHLLLYEALFHAEIIRAHWEDKVIMTHRMDKQPDPDQAQFHDLALVHAHTASVQAAARRLQSDPTGTSAITEMKMLLGVPTTLARSALDRLQGRNRSGARLRLVPLDESPGGEQ